MQEEQIPERQNPEAKNKMITLAKVTVLPEEEVSEEEEE